MLCSFSLNNKAGTESVKNMYMCMPPLLDLKGINGAFKLFIFLNNSLTSGLYSSKSIAPHVQVLSLFIGHKP